MFSEPETIAIDYHPGPDKTHFRKIDVINPNTRKAHNLLLVSYMTVRSNCEDSCATDLLSNLPEDEVDFYRKNSKIGQMDLKEIINPTSRGLDSCIRLCFGK